MMTDSLVKRKYPTREKFEGRVIALVAKLMTADLKRFKVAAPKDKILEQATAIVQANGGVIDKWWRDGDPPMQADEMAENQITYPIRPTFLDWALK